MQSIQIYTKKRPINYLGSRKSSIKSTLKFHLSGSEDEQSLERIHTFNLKTDAKMYTSDYTISNDYDDLIMN